MEKPKTFDIEKVKKHWEFVGTVTSAVSLVFREDRLPELIEYLSKAVEDKNESLKFEYSKQIYNLMLSIMNLNSELFESLREHSGYNPDEDDTQLESLTILKNPYTTLVHDFMVTALKFMKSLTSDTAGIRDYITLITVMLVIWEFDRLNKSEGEYEDELKY